MEGEVEGEVEGGKLKGKRTTFIWRTGPGLDTKISEVKTAYIPLFILTFTAATSTTRYTFHVRKPSKQTVFLLPIYFQYL